MSNFQITEAFASENGDGFVFIRIDNQYFQLTRSEAKRLAKQIKKSAKVREER